MLGELFSEASGRLPALTSNTAAYQKLIVGLILQGVYQLMEPKIMLQCRTADVEIVRAAAGEAKGVYEKEMKGTKEIEFVIDEANPLEKTSPGGVVLSVMEGRIRAKNTLDERLELLGEKMLPDIRILLFGVSESRAFYN
jgi:V-type H+-transporting ATPase subunit E